MKALVSFEPYYIVESFITVKSSTSLGENTQNGQLRFVIWKPIFIDFYLNS